MANRIKNAGGIAVTLSSVTTTAKGRRKSNTPLRRGP
jgi:hypothetical protein